MSLSLVVVDNGDSTVTLTVSGSVSAGTVYATRFRGQEGPQVPLATAWAFTGDGSSSPLLITPAHYFWIAKDSSGLSSIVYKSVQDPAPAVYTAARQAIADRIKLLTLQGIYNNVKLQWLPNDLTSTYPMVAVTHPESGGEQDVTGTNSTTQWGYPVRVLIADRIDRMQDDANDHFDKWRKQVRNAFSRQRLPGTSSEVLETWVEPGNVASKYRVLNASGAEAYQLIGSEMTIRVRTRELNGFGV